MNDRSGSLADIKVVDASRVLGGPYTGQILGDHGADVIKIEPPAGDETRGWGPPFLDGTASYFLGLNRNKRGMVVDLSLAPGRELLLRLLETADVFIENFKTGTLERWGLGRAELRAAFPGSRPLPHLGFRRGRPAWGAARLRRGDPGLDRDHERERGARRRTPPGRTSGG